MAANGNGSSRPQAAQTFQSSIIGAQMAGTIQSAAMEVGQRGGDVYEAANAMAQAWEKKLEAKTAEYLARLNAQSAQPQAGGPVLPIGAGYLMWDVFLAGPFQAIGNPPFRPQKILRASDPSFFLAAFWRNPAPPVSANLLMAGQTVDYWAETVNLTGVTNGPDLPAGGGPGSFVLNAGVVTVQALIVPGNTFPGGPPNKPNLYEVNLTARIPANPVFTAFSTWHFDPDGEFPTLFTPAVSPGFEYGIPARFLVYN